MALDGGGGGGLLGVSNSFTGPSDSLELVGDHGFAYSGIISNSSSTVIPYLKFTTGNFYFVGEVAFFDSEGGNSDVFMELKLNGAIIVKARYAGSPNIANLEQATRVIIPSYTEFEGLLGTDVTQDLTMSMTGRIYR